jgi:hypothetical protein
MDFLRLLSGSKLGRRGSARQSFFCIASMTAAHPPASAE